MPGLLEKLKKFGQECAEIAITEYRKAQEKAKQQKAQAASVQAAQNLGQQMHTQQHPHQSPGLTAAQRSRLEHMKGLHAQASQISHPDGAIDHRYPVGHPLRTKRR